MNDTLYFSHNYNSRNDPKIKDLLAEHGITGYGVFWALIEDLYNNTNVLRLNYKTIAYDLRVDVSVVKSVINDFALFDVNDETFSSKSVGERLKLRQEKSLKASESVKKRWEKYERDTNVLPKKNDAIANKSKRENKKENNTKDSFQSFWDAYAKKNDREKCEAKWEKLTIQEHEAIMIDIPKYLATITDKQFQKNPLTYLNGKCWLDERDNKPTGTAKENPAPRKYLNSPFNEI